MRAPDQSYLTRYYKVSVGALIGIATSLIVAASSSTATLAQTANQSPAQTQPNSQPLPPVVVQTAPPTQKPAAKTKSKTKTAQKTGPSKPSQQTPTEPMSAPQSQPETATSTVKGIVAKVSGTATKTDTPILETPQSVSVVTRAQMDQQGAKTVAQALEYTSGVDADNRTGFSGFDIVYARGFSLDRFLDGLKYPTGSSSTVPQMELYGLERLEVLHGPASVLYGAGSPGGIVEAVSKRPLDEPYHEVELTFGNFDHIEGAFDFSDRLSDDGKW